MSNKYLVRAPNFFLQLVKIVFEMTPIFAIGHISIGKGAMQPGKLVGKLCA